MTRRWLAAVVVVCAVFGGTAVAAAQSSKQWGALAFSQDGNYSVVTKYPSWIGASDKAQVRCEDLGHGRCQVVEVPGDSCAALATYVGPDPDKRNRYSRSGVGDSIAVAERLALINAGCEKSADRDKCKIKASFCANGSGALKTTDFVQPPSGIKMPERGAGAKTGPEAQLAAMRRCNEDSRARGRCQLRTMVCGDGR